MTNKTFSSDYLADLACQALTFEVQLAPKPGLVDPWSNGAHQDMTTKTFAASIEALRPYFKGYVQLGQTHAGAPDQLFSALRQLGKEAEAAMLAATAGVNTHKGANFSFALLLGALGACRGDLEASWSLIKAMTQHLVTQDFAHLAQKASLSYGERLYLEHGITGVRGEAAAGYPVLRQGLLPFVYQRQDLDQRQLWLQALVYLMATVQDGNLLHRGGLSALAQIQDEMNRLLGQLPNLSLPQLEERLMAYDQVLIERHLSPGGSADFLALGYFCTLIPSA